MFMKVKVLFVCTGNIFRSMLAEKTCEQYCKLNNITDFEFKSAWITAQHKNSDMYPLVRNYLEWLWIDTTKHIPTILDEELLKWADLIIPMSIWQKVFIDEHFLVYPKDILLFNELLLDETKSVKDVEEVVVDYKTNKKAKDEFIKKTCEYISDNAEKFIKNIIYKYNNFEVIQKQKKHSKWDLPFEVLCENENSLAFLSFDIPVYEDWHILVIPKKKYKDFHNIPDEVLFDMMKLTKKLWKSILKNHDWYNILLNDWVASGQYIFHAHIHIIPRNYNDKIKIEIRKKRKNITKQEFLDYNNMLKENLNGI